MWCANGYATFSEIQKALRQIIKSDAGSSKIIETMQQGFSGSFDAWISNSFDTMTYEEARAIVSAECIKEFFSECPSLSVFSQSGMCMRVENRIAAYHEFPDLGWQHLFIDGRSGTVSEKQFMRCSAKLRQKLPDMRKKIEEIDEDESAYFSYIKLCHIEDDLEIWDFIKIFDGWAIGCDLNDVPNSPEELVSLDLLYEWSASARKPPNLKDAIIEAFDGNLIRSKQSLWKDHFPDETREAFRAAWAEAALERPNLSKRGPK